jgi:hypothetical protein
MSLIQEALKRQQEEQDGRFPRADDPIPTGAVPPKPGKPAAATPPAPPPPPGASAPPEPAKTGAGNAAALDADAPLPDLESRPRPEKARAWKTLALIMLVLLLLGGGAVWMIAYAVRGLTGQAPAHAAPANAALPAATAPANATLPTETDAAAPDPEPAAAETPVRATAPPAPAPAPAPPTPAPSAVPDVADRTPVNWPTLHLTGLIGRGKAGSAVINGGVVGIGDTVEGARVLGIRRDGVEMEYKGDRQVLKVGTAAR